MVTLLQLVERLEDAGGSNRGSSESVTVKRVSIGTKPPSSGVSRLCRVGGVTISNIAKTYLQGQRGKCFKITRGKGSEYLKDDLLVQVPKRL